MKSKWAIALVACCWLHLNAWSASNPVEHLIVSGTRALERQVLTNEENDRTGRSHLNNYLVILDDSGEHIEERGDFTRLVSPEQLQLLDEELKAFHRQHVQGDRPGFYVLLINNWKVRLARQLPANFTLNEWSDLRSFAAESEHRQLDRMMAQLNSVPSEILVRLKNKGHNRLAYVYMYARITTVGVDTSVGSVELSSTKTKSRQFVSQVLRAADNDTQSIKPYVLDVRQLLLRGYNTHFERVAANIRNFVSTFSTQVFTAGRAEQATALGIGRGPGHDLFIHAPPDVLTKEPDRQEFIVLCRHLNEQAGDKDFAFWYPGLTRATYRLQDGEQLHEDVLKHLFEWRIHTVEQFELRFVKRSCRGFGTLWLDREHDITADIPSAYNQLSKDHHRGGLYEYSLDDLVSRREQRELDSYFWKAIVIAERSGKAEAVSQADGVEQYVALYNHTSSLFFWMKNYFIEVAEPATIVNAVRALNRFKMFSPKSELRAASEVSVSASKRLRSLEMQYKELSPESKITVDNLAQVDGIAIVGDEAGEELLILGRQQADEYAEVGRVVNGRVEPLQYIDKGTPIDAAVDGHQLGREGEEVGFLKKVDDGALSLSKFDAYDNIRSWTSSLRSTDDKLIEKLSLLDRTDLEKLNIDIVHRNYGGEIRELLQEHPDDVVDIWKRLKDDPAFSWELQKTGGSRWEKWGQREFFKDVTGKGKHFERDVCLAALRNRESAAYLELKSKVSADFGKNLDEYDLYSQVQLKYEGEEYFVADQLFVRYTRIAGQNVADDIVVVENKLSATTPFTTPQLNAKSKALLVVRSQLVISEFGTGPNLSSGENLTFVDKIQWVKVSDGKTGNEISLIQTLK